MAGLNYYKAKLASFFGSLHYKVAFNASLLQASFHNYVIFTPSKEDLLAAGFSGSIYSFHSGRDKASASVRFSLSLSLSACLSVCPSVSPVVCCLFPHVNL